MVKSWHLHEWCRACRLVLLGLLLIGHVHADELQEQFDAAMKAMDQHRLRTAREALLDILRKNPQLHRARLELARVYYLAYDYDQARSEAQRVLDDPNTPPSVRTTVLAFLAQIDEDQKRIDQRHQWTPSLYVGGLYDSNVNVGPDRDVIDISGSLFLLTPGSKQRGDFAVVVNPGIAHTYNPGKRFELGEHKGFFLWQSAADFYYRQYLSENDYSLGVLTLRTGPAWVVPGQWRASVGLQGDQIWLGNESLALFGTLNPTVTWQVAENTDLTLDGAVTRRHYWQDADNGRDGWYRSADVLLGHSFGKEGIAVQGGIGYSDFSADDDRFGHHGPEVFAGVVAPAGQLGTVYARAEYRRYLFEGPEPVFNYARDDDEFRSTLGFQHDIGAGPLIGWSLVGNWIYTRNDSNVPIYDYDRHQINLGLSRTF